MSAIPEIGANPVVASNRDSWFHNFFLYQPNFVYNFFLKSMEIRGHDAIFLFSKNSIVSAEFCYVAPPKAELDREMARFLNWLNAANEPEALLKAGIAHLWFIMIHPFDDGNGRIGRAVTDFLLARSYPSLMELVSFSKYISRIKRGITASSKLPARTAWT